MAVAESFSYIFLLGWIPASYTLCCSPTKRRLRKGALLCDEMLFFTWEVLLIPSQGIFSQTECVKRNLRKHFSFFVMNIF